MSRSSKILAGVVAALAGLWLVYSGAWLYESRWIAGQIAALAVPPPGRPALKAEKTEVSGYPFKLKVVLSAVEIDAATGMPELQQAILPRIEAESRPWAFKRWRFYAPAGAEGHFKDGGVMSAGTLGGRVSVDDTSAASAPAALQLKLDIAGFHVVEKDRTISADGLNLIVTLPPQPPSDHQGVSGTFSVSAEQVHLPQPVPPLGDTIAHFAVAGTVNGAVPLLPLTQALDAWRKQGGTLDLHDLDLEWRDLAVAGNGTLALDGGLQPIGAFSMTLSGYDAILEALATSGQLKPAEAGYMRMGLDLLAQPEGGKRVLKAPVTVQDGGLYIGPAKISTLPKIRW
jgi:hypothetical protein